MTVKSIKEIQMAINVKEYIQWIEKEEEYKIKLQKEILEKEISVKEIRQRGFQKRNDVKIGVRVDEDVEYGELICIIDGMIYLKNQISQVHIIQSFLHFFEELDLVLLSDDKPFRKGCYPNAILKLIKCEDKYLMGIYSVKNINKNDEIILSFDYDHGNKYVEYKCCCYSNQYCLNPKMISKD